jgi:hypothetical protein
LNLHTFSSAHPSPLPSRCPLLQWVVSVQLGTNSFFVNNVLGVAPCGHHATMRGSDKACMDVPCKCVAGPDGKSIPNVIRECHALGHADRVTSLRFAGVLPTTQTSAVTDRCTICCGCRHPIGMTWLGVAVCRGAPPEGLLQPNAQHARVCVYCLNYTFW